MIDRGWPKSDMGPLFGYIRPMSASASRTWADQERRTPGTGHVKRRQVDWRWEDPDAQAVFVEWVGFPKREATAREVDAVERLLALRRTERVLDVGCGNGRHAIEMAKRGYRVVGIDVADSYLREAERQAERTGTSVEFRLQRASHITEEACYESVLAINHTLGFMDDDELGSQFQRLAKALRPGGKLLLQTAGPQCPGEGDSPATRSWAEKNGRFILCDKRMVDRVRIEHCIVIDPGKREIVEYHEEQRAFSRDEVVRLLRNSGFRAIECLSDLSGNAASDEAFGVYVCAR
jgi:2-polyprenyl-3-methyl-5-hydroxy-6-metoxy-1,4-benzoquinol methylase